MTSAPVRWLITGGGGQVATHAHTQLIAAGVDAVVLSQDELDITEAASIAHALDAIGPDVVLNAAGYTAVDAAESDEAAAALVNVLGPRLLAEALAGHGGRLIHISTDYVFDGTAERPYEPGDAVAPRSAYGRTKLAGEQAVRAVLPERSHIVRTAWVYGGPGPNFVDTMLRLERERDTVDVVDDQRGCPTWAGDLASALIALGHRPDVTARVLHYVNTGQATWCDLARETFRLAGADPARVRPTTSAAFRRAAHRPAWSVLSTTAWTAAGLPAPRSWQDALTAAFAAVHS